MISLLKSCYADTVEIVDSLSWISFTWTRWIIKMDSVWKWLGYLQLLRRKISSTSSPSLAQSKILILLGEWVLLSHQIWYHIALSCIDSEDKNSVNVVHEVRSGEQACTAYVMFKDSYSQETAVLLSVSLLFEFDSTLFYWRITRFFD